MIYIHKLCYESLLDSVLCITSSRLTQNYTDIRPSEQTKAKVKFIVDYVTKANSRYKCPNLYTVTEHDYVDRDYVLDYSTYYSRCMSGKYKSLCSRIHFFGSSEGRTHRFWNQLKSKTGTSANCKDMSYFGFVVIRPLPETWLGRTCLISIHSDQRDYAEGRYVCTAGRDYKVHLLGAEYRVRSLAFQEQDREVSACATTALWMAFHRTSVDFDHQVPPPSKITRVGNEIPGTRYNEFPSRGLNIIQAVNAIHDVGLSHYSVTIANLGIFLALVRAYTYIGIPIIVFGSIYSINSKTSDKRPIFHSDGEYHAVVAVGYHFTPDACKSQFTSNKIDSILLHDDQVGPFVDFELLNGVNLYNYGYPGDDCSNEFVNIDGVLTRRHESGFLLYPRGHDFAHDRVHHFRPVVAIVPIYSKIRLDIISALKYFVADSVKRHLEEYDMEIDIYLSSIHQFKSWAKSNSDRYTSRSLSKTLASNYPRFLWRCDYRINGHIVGYRLIDATDIYQGDFHLATHMFDDNMLVPAPRQGEYFP